MARQKLRTALAGLLLLALLPISACSLYREDRIYLTDQQYAFARKSYDSTGSLVLTEKALVDKRWQRGQINEARYRLTKQYRLEK
jgi:hypothetical protein